MGAAHARLWDTWPLRQPAAQHGLLKYIPQLFSQPGRTGHDIHPFTLPSFVSQPAEPHAQWLGMLPLAAPCLFQAPEVTEKEWQGAPVESVPPWSGSQQVAAFINNWVCRTWAALNHFWTGPTNRPANMKTIDLSHSFLFQVLPGSLDRLPRLTHFHLHDNRFSTLPFSALDKLMWWPSATSSPGPSSTPPTL